MFLPLSFIFWECKTEIKQGGSLGGCLRLPRFSPRRTGAEVVIKESDVGRGCQTFLTTDDSLGLVDLTLHLLRAWAGRDSVLCCPETTREPLVGFLFCSE